MQDQPVSPDLSNSDPSGALANDSFDQARHRVLDREELLAELELVRERLSELEDIEVQRITDEHDRFDSLNVLDEYAQQLEESRDKLARLLQGGVAIEEARSTHEILQTAANAVGAAGWASVVVYLFDNFEVKEAAFHGVCDEDIVDLEQSRRPSEERARMFAPDFVEFKVSRSYFVPAERLHEFIHSRYVVPGRRESMPGDDWDPMDLAYVPMLTSTGKVLGTINCDDPVNGKRPNAEVFRYLEIFSDLAARKIETVQLLNRQAKIESQLRESEEKYRTIFDRSADGFFLMDDLFRECNDAALKLFGCEHDDIIGHAPSEFSPKFQPDGQRSDKIAAELISKARSGLPQNFEWVHVRKDGAELNCEVSLAAIDVSGRSMVMAIVRDISERKRMAHDKETTAIASQLFLSARSMELVFSQLPKILTSRFPVSIAAVELYDQATDELILAGEENTALPIGFRVPVGMSVSGTVIRSGEPVIDAQTSRRPDYAHPDLRRLGLQKIVCVPLRVRDISIGVIWLASSQHVPSVEQALLELNQILIPLNIVANYLAQAIDRQRTEEELVDLKQFFENLLDNLPAQVSVYDVQGNYRYANRASVDDDSLREWIIGQNDEDLQIRRNQPPEIGKRRLTAIADAVGKRELVTFEERARDAQEREHYYLKAISPVADSAGRVEYVIGYGLEITDTKLWEQEQQLLLQLPTENPFPVLACASDGSVLYMNSASEKLEATLGGRDVGIMLPIDHSQAIAELTNGSARSVVKTLQTDKVNLRWTYCLSSNGQIHLYGHELPTKIETPIAVVGSQLQLNDVLASGISAPVWLIDSAGNTVTSSQSAKDLLTALGVDGIRNLLDDDFWAKIVSFRGVVGEQLTSESQRQSRALKWTVSLMKDQLRLVELLDMSEVRDLQDKLRHAQKLEAMGRLAGGIAHDFNNLLTGIIGNLELFEHAETLSSDSRDCVREAARAAERASILVKQLLNYSRKSPDELRALDPNIVCSSVARMLARTVDRRITVLEKFENEVWHISVDSNQLEQILMNLGVNAADAISEILATSQNDQQQPAIQIKTENIDAYPFVRQDGRKTMRQAVAISVIDNGCGMPIQIKDRMFDAFFTTKAENKGTGLGLSIVAELVEGFGGAIEVETQVGMGTTIRFLLPRTESAILSKSPARMIANVRGGTETVLIVDDEPVIIDLGREVLEHAGYNVLVARDGREAIEVFDQNLYSIDLVIMDISLPIMSGDEAVSIMLAKREDIPIILSSGLPDASAERRKISLGSVAFIQKPYRPSELLSAIREVLDHVK